MTPTGGEELDPLASVLPTTVEAASDQAYGVAKFELRAHSYNWRFTSTNTNYTDAGSGICHGPAKR